MGLAVGVRGDHPTRNPLFHGSVFRLPEVHDGALRKPPGMGPAETWPVLSCVRGARMSAEIIHLSHCVRPCDGCEGKGAFVVPTFSDGTCTQVVSFEVSACKKCKGRGKVATRPATDPWMAFAEMP